MRDVICLMGPTASGKTAFACELLQHMPCEIISVDSALIYRGMDIGTAKPDAETLALAPHHLIDIKNPNEAYSVAEFCDDAKALCDAIHARGRLPLMVGGTMMYFRAFIQGLSALPQRDSDVREALRQEEKTHGLDYLYQTLKEVDAVTAARLHPHDTQRIHRALEVYRITGHALSDAHRDIAAAPAAAYRCLNVLLFPNARAWLHERIARRFDQMLKEGFLGEVKALCRDWQLDASYPSMRSVGYRQALDYQKGLCDYDTFCAKALAATRQLAKRQITWLRSWPDGYKLAPEDEGTFEHMLQLLKREVNPW